MSKSINNGERIFDWAQQVMQVGFVQMINKKFAGLVLHDKRDAKAVIALLDELLGELTHIENVTETGLGIPLITVKESSQYQEGAKAERERIIELVDGWQVALCKCDVCKAVREISAAIKGEQK